MSMLKIYTCFDPVIRKKAQKVEFSKGEYGKLIKNMIETMHKANGIGLAAPQVGESIQLIVCCPSLKKGEEIVLFNPKVVSSKGSLVFEEGCLSVPEIIANVKRAKEITVEALDHNGNDVTIEADDIYARVLLHEIDHLHGVLFIDRVSFLQKTRIKKKLSALGKKLNKKFLQNVES